MSAYSQTIDFELTRREHAWMLKLISGDGMNRLTRAKVLALRREIDELAASEGPPLPLIIFGEKNFSAGADLNEIRELTAPQACEFSRDGQGLMYAIANYPATVIAAIEGHCMGGGLDLALACDRRIAATGSVFGHRGAALGLITGWGGTQRLPRLVGKATALEIFVTAEKISATRALSMGLVNAVAQDPMSKALDYASSHHQRPIQE